MAERPPRAEPEDPESEDAMVLRLLSQAEGLLALGRPEAAVGVTELLPAGGPYRDAITRVRGWALLQSSSYAELIQLLALEDRLDGELLYLLGTARARAGATDEGRADLERLRWREPAGAWGLAALRELADVPGVYSATERAMIRAYVPPATPRSALEGGSHPPDHGAVLDLLRRRAPRRSRLEAEVYRSLGVRYLARDDLDAAVTALRRALSTQGAGTGTLRRAVEVHLGEALRRRGSLRSATRHFDRVIAGGDDTLTQQALALAGQMFIEHRRYREANERFEALLVRNPVGPSRREALRGLGWVAFRTGRMADARRFFATLLAEDPYGEHAAASIYWGARALEELGDAGGARAELAALVARFPIDYYAHRAAEHLDDLGGSFDEVAVTLPEPPPHRRRVHIDGLVAAEMPERALAELRGLEVEQLTSMGPNDLDALAELSRSLGATTVAARVEAIRNRRFPETTGASARALARQFPAETVRLLRQAARRERVPEDLVIALVRQESGFDARAVSSAGALGLMQLMPQTGKELLRELDPRARATAEVVLDPETNIRLGVRYLGRMLRAFRGNVEMAIAAYNAGPGAVTRWRQGMGEIPPDIFVEEIPYAETNEYVRRVLTWRSALRLVEAAGGALTTLGDGRKTLSAGRRPGEG